MRYDFSDTYRKEVIIRNDTELILSAPCVVFEKPVRIVNCYITELMIYACYFLEGLELFDCFVKSRVIWQSGGHNEKKILISSCTFHEFVDLEDCWFMEPIEFNKVRFLQGTNLFGNKNTPMAITFEKGCMIKDVTGDLAVDTYQNPQ